jgi:hypothetical protein
MSTRFSLIVLVLAIALALTSASIATAQEPELAFVGADEGLTAELTGSRSDDLSVWLKNTSDRVVTPSFAVVLENKSGEPVNSKVEVSGGRTAPLSAYDVGLYRIHLVDGTSSKGELVASAAGVSPASVSIAVGKKLPVGRGVNGVLLGSLGLAFLVTLICAAWIFIRKNVKLTAPLGSVELDFSKSFASTLTAVGAILGTIISAGVLPEQTVNLSKTGFTGLNLTFGLAIVVSGVVYSMVQRIVPDDDAAPKEWKLKGFVLPFLMAALITLWAVFGELWTMWLLLGELGSEGGFSGTGVAVGRGLLLVGFLAMLPYTFTRIQLAIREKPDSDKETVALGQKPIKAPVEPLQPVKLL